MTEEEPDDDRDDPGTDEDQLARALANLDHGLEKLPPAERSAAVQEIELAMTFIQTVFAALGGTEKEIERLRNAIDGDM